MLTRGWFLNIGIITFPRHKLCRLSEDPLSPALHYATSGKWQVFLQFDGLAPLSPHDATSF
ncbi:hypothetical protein CES93_20455 [Citrobacter freundii]|uniref:Uncharacterized protein n=1 Tax=Citrobacter freundii TaxID=546 RepID=A0AAD1X424_CITFR|nr:hypothetical protein CES93_20455 [Citrobacter freundii]OIZ40558.1 hypothetical protein BEH73_04040 [Citrobacter freundii]CAF2824901.1 hypothetical protein AI2935V1_3866 [Citrobacter freundii]CAH6609440.1 hypothetical protein AI2935V1_3866 [Citrobacter freundii]